MTAARLGAGALAVLAAVTLTSWLTPDIPTRVPNVPPALPACQLEDSPGPCYWDASTRGNGRGMSFIRHADGTLTYPKGH